MSTLPKGLRGYLPPATDVEGIAVPAHVSSDKLGPRVPMKSNSPSQWIAASGMILRVLVGSTVHGTAVDGQDDEDQMGICVEPTATVVGLRKFTHYEFRTAVEREGGGSGVAPKSGPGDLDLIVYGLRRYASLAAAGNPSILLPLFVPDSAVFWINDFGRELRTYRDMFLSKRVAARFLGYLENQRLGVLGKRSVPSRQELRDLYGWDPKYGMHMVRLGMQGAELIEHGTITLPMRGEQLQQLRELRRGERSKEWALEQAALYEEKIEYIVKTSSKLPDEPNWDRINHWITDVHLRHWGVG